MPKKPKRACPGRGPRRNICRNLINGTDPCCPECMPYVKKAKQLYDDERGNSGQRGYDFAWQKVRAMKVSQDPLCEECFLKGYIKPTEVVHHIKPIETHPELRLVMSNLMSLCNEHHEEIHKPERWGRG